MPLNRLLFNHGHVHRFLVISDLEGWDVREEEDEDVVSHTHRDDWHRVETDVHLFDLTALALKQAGWIEH